MEDKDSIEKLKLMTMEEKMSHLSETDKAYVCGYIDRALSEKGKVKNE